MAYWQYLLPVLFHRIGLILTFVCSALLIVLPSIYNQEDDIIFATRLYHILINMVRVGLILLVITGIIRLQTGIPAYFPIKAIFAVVTVIVAFRSIPTYDSQQYNRFVIILFLLIILTAVVGIYL